MGEIWKDIEGYEGKYQISNLGRIRSVKTQYKILKPDLYNGRGYANITLIKDDEKFKTVIHRLVAKAFIPNPKDKPIVNHINGNKLDNRADNLEWCTESENAEHAYKTGLRKGLIGEKNPFYGKRGAKSPRSRKINQFSLDGKFIKQWGSIVEAKKETGANNIGMCCKGLYEYSGNYIWRYVDE